MNNINYDKLFQQNKEKNVDKRLLLQVCCAPCATYCLTQLLDTYAVTLYYANDNITAPAEWQKRLGEVEKLVEIVNGDKFEVTPKFPLQLVVQQQNSQRFFDAARGLETQPEGGLRCEKCFLLRLSDAKSYAETHGFEMFGTTLTVSPYKNNRLLNEIGLSLQTEQLGWLESDFKKRNGYLESVRLSAKYELYRQHYCGCAFSIQ